MMYTDSCFIDFTIVIFGLLIGSFITLVSYRLPIDSDIIVKRSHCAKCNHNLGVKDLFPLFSWLFSGGKCRYCKAAISARYPLIEIATAAITFFIYKKFGLQIITILYLITCYSLLILIITDFEHYIIPDSIQIILAISALAIAYLKPSSLVDSLLAGVIGLVLGLVLKYGFIWLRKKDGLGMGDVKFMAVAGLYLGITPLPSYFFIAGMIGILTSILWKFLKKGEIFPFGPALAIAMVICMLAPETVNFFTQSIFYLTSLFSNHLTNVPL